MAKRKKSTRFGAITVRELHHFCTTEQVVQFENAVVQRIILFQTKKHVVLCQQFIEYIYFLMKAEHRPEHVKNGNITAYWLLIFLGKSVFEI